VSHDLNPVLGLCPVAVPTSFLCDPASGVSFLGPTVLLVKRRAKQPHCSQMFWGWIPESLWGNVGLGQSHAFVLLLQMSGCHLRLMFIKK